VSPSAPLIATRGKTYHGARPMGAFRGSVRAPAVVAFQSG
jgi:hypothetical protein